MIRTKQTEMKILGIGEAVIDKIQVIERTSGSWSTAKVVAKSQDAGGPVVAALLLLSKMGHDCTISASIGQDADGRHLRQIFRQGNVTLRAHKQPLTKVNTILVDAHSGQRKKIRGSVTHEPTKGFDREFLESFDLILIDRHERAAFYEVIANKDARTKLIVDPSTEVSEFTLEMIRHADVPIVPIETLCQLADGRGLAETAEGLYRECQKTIFVTLGRFGSLLYDGKEAMVIPGLSVNTVNANGAGDVFRGAFAFGLLENWPLEKCAAFANAAAAVQCTKLGNATVVPNMEEIRAGIERYRKLDVGLPFLEAHFKRYSNESSTRNNKSVNFKSSVQFSTQSTVA